MGFASGFSAGFNAVSAGNKDKREQDQHEAEKALREKLKAIETMGVTEQVSGDDAMRNFREGYVRPEGGVGADEFIAQNPETFKGLDNRPAGHIVNGKFSVAKPTDDQLDAEKSRARIAAIRGVDPERAMNYEANMMKVNDAKRQEAFKAGWGDKFKATPWGAALAEGREPTVGEQFQSSMDMFAYQAESGMASPEHMMAAAEKMNVLGAENYTKTMQALHSGASKATIVQAFNASGEKLDPSMLGEPRAVEVDIGGGQKVKTFEIDYTDADGKKGVLNGFRELDAVGRGSEAFGRAIKLGDMAVENRKVGIAGAAESRAAKKDSREERLSQEGREALADMDAAEQAGNTKAYKAARNRAVRAGIKLEKDAQVKGEFKPNPMGMGGTAVQTLPNGSITVTPVPEGVTGAITIPAPGAQSGGKTGWDSATGKVLVGGVEVGVAKTEAEARALVARAKQPPPQPGNSVQTATHSPTQTPAPETPAPKRTRKQVMAEISQLKKNEPKYLGQDFDGYKAKLEALSKEYVGLMNGR